jgi:hypothetical protein
MKERRPGIASMKGWFCYRWFPALIYQLEIQRMRMFRRMRVESEAV